jgi:hypothetical protein
MEGQFSCISCRSSLVHVSWFSVGAWLLGRSKYKCIWLAKFSVVFCWLQLVRKSQVGINPIYYHFIYNGMAAAWQHGQVPSRFWQMGQVVGVQYGCTELHACGCKPEPCGWAWHFFFPEAMLAFVYKELRMSSWKLHINSVNTLCSKQWTDGLRPYLILISNLVVLSTHVGFYSTEIWENEEPFSW